jgi:hypothetical protein
MIRLFSDSNWAVAALVAAAASPAFAAGLNLSRHP